MKFIENDCGGLHVLELTRRNLEALLEKLDDPLSKCSLVDPDRKIMVRSVPNEKHYANRAPGDVYMPTTGVIH